MGRDILNQVVLLKDLSSLAFNTSRDGDNIALSQTVWISITAEECWNFISIIVFDKRGNNHWEVSAIQKIMQLTLFYKFNKPYFINSCENTYIKKNERNVYKHLNNSHKCWSFQKFHEDDTILRWVGSSLLIWNLTRCILTDLE